MASLPVEDVDVSLNSTATDTTAWVDVSAKGNFIVTCIAHNGSGTTPTLDWTIEQSFDGTNSGSTLTNIAGSFTQVTTSFPKIQSKVFAPSGDVTSWARWIRVKRTLTGTSPVYTTSVQIRSLTFKD